MAHPEITAEIITRDCLAARVRLLNRRVLRMYDEALRPLGIKVTQLNVLVVLSRLGPQSPTEVTHVLDMEKSTLSRNVERLRLRGLVEVRPGPSGRTQRVPLRFKITNVLLNRSGTHDRTVTGQLLEEYVVYHPIISQARCKRGVPCVMLGLPSNVTGACTHFSRCS